MSSILSQLLSLLQMEYLAVDRRLTILETSSGVQQFADSPNEVALGRNICLSFPELIGIEDILISILEGRQAGFELKGIARSSAQSHPVYINLYIVSKQEKDSDSKLIVFVENVSQRMILEQKLVQKTNEVSLLLEAWDFSNEYLNQIIQSVGNALLVTTETGIIKIANKAAKILFKYSHEEEIVGKPISTLVVEYQLLLEASEQYLVSQEFLRDVEVTGLTKDGTNVVIAFSCSAIQTTREHTPDFIYVGWEVPKPE
jgi:PAS domain S-box-containing protein